MVQCAMRPNKSSWSERVFAARRARDLQLGPEALPPLRLSDVKRRQRRARPVALLILGLWIVSQWIVIVLVRPLMVAYSNWYGLLIVLYLIPSIALMHYGLVRVQRWVGLRCPYCGATFIYTDLKRPETDPVAAKEHKRRCGRCHAVIIDLEA